MEQAAWPRAIVMSEDGAEKMNIAIPFLGKTRNLNRPKDEPLSKVMVRIRQSAMPPPPKGGKKARSKGFVPGAAPAEEVSAPPPAEVEIECLLECSVDGVVSEDTLNQDAWVHGRTLRVGASRFLVHVNPPVIEDLRIPRRPLAGIPQRPAISLRFAEASECRWQWFRARPQAGQAPSEEQDRWERIEDGGGDAMVYTPGERDVGKQLKLECTPRRMAGPGAALEVSGDVASAVTDSEVVPGPAKSAGEGRHALAAGRDVGKSGVRVMSYNLLASAYADTEVARTQLFGYVPRWAMHTEYRKQLQLQEILGFQPDIVCLQELDMRAFETYFQPHFADHGFEGLFSGKLGSGQEGEGIFFRSSKFTLAAQRTLSLRSFFSSLSSESTDDQPVGGEAGGTRGKMRELLGRPGCEELKRVLTEKLTTVAQIALLVPPEWASGGAGDGGEGRGAILVVNTHLFYHPMASHIRMLQVAAILEEVRAASAEWASLLPAGVRPALVMVGDLNSEPDTGAIRYLASGQVASSHPEWEAHAAFAWGDADEEVETEGGAEGDASEKVGGGTSSAAGERGGREWGVDLEHEWELASADELATSFTNYVRGYIGCLDYIFYQPSRMAVSQVIPLPPESELLATALPSPRFPSDHLSLCVDLAFLPSASSPPPAPPASFRFPARLATRLKCPQPATPHLVYKAVEALRRGAFVAVPTDTLYGLGAAADSADAVAAMVACKKRAPNKAVAIAVAEVADISRFAHSEGLPPGLLSALLPGPVTVILTRRADAALAAALSPRGTVGIRVPGADPNRITRREDFSFVREVARGLGGAVALTSANLSNRTSSVDVEDFRELWPSCALVLDGRALSAGTEGSTVVDLTEVAAGGGFVLVRAGCAAQRVLDVLETFGVARGPDRPPSP